MKWNEQETDKAHPASTLGGARTFELLGVLTIAEGARELRFSKAHLAKVLNGQVPGVPYLPHLRIGRRLLIRRSTLYQWMAERHLRLSRFQIRTQAQEPLLMRTVHDRTVSEISKIRPRYDRENLGAAAVIAGSPELHPGLMQEWARAVREEPASTAKVKESMAGNLFA